MQYRRYNESIASTLTELEDYAEIIKDDLRGRMWRCRFCGKFSIQKNDFRKHLRIHFGDKPFICPHCDYRTTQKGNLNLHISRRHSSFQNV